ncbi:MAG: septum formation initiator family protein [Desulfobacterales bacterium]|nr:septum formation initiator family protein [Desulfobacterales bacterium]
MNTRNKILLSFAILALFSMLLFIVFNEYGLADFRLLKQDRDRLLQKNAQLEQENLSLYRQIDRLKNDLKFIESVARQELGMVGKDEVVFKLKKPEKDKKDE